jgi:hypothetical protein
LLVKGLAMGILEKLGEVGYGVDVEEEVSGNNV